MILEYFRKTWWFYALLNSKSNQDDGTVIMKSYAQWNAVQVQAESRLQRNSNLRPRVPKSGPVGHENDSTALLITHYTRDTF